MVSRAQANVGEVAAARLRTLLAVCAGSTWVAAAALLVDSIKPADAWPRAALCMAWLIFAPLYVPGFTTRLAPRRVSVSGTWVLLAIPAAFLPLDVPITLVVASFCLFSGYLFAQHEDDMGALGSLVLGPLAVGGTLTIAPSPLLLLLAPISWFASLGALVLLHARMSRRRVRGAQRLVVRDADGSGRLRYAVLLAGGTLIAGALAFVAVDALVRDPRPAEGQLAGAPDVDTATSASTEGRVAGQGDGQGSFSTELLFSGGTLPFSDALFMRVTPLAEEREPGYVGSLHMRSMVLDQFSAEGASLADRRPPPVYEDVTDGVRDGWTRVDRARTGDAELALRIESAPLAVDPMGWTLVFSPDELRAITLPVRYGPDQILATPEPHEDWLTYEVRCAPRGLPPGLVHAPTRHPNDLYVQLPEDRTALEPILSLSAELASGSRSDLDRVLRVVTHLTSEFEYDLSDFGFGDANAIATFLERKRGSCTFFASSAALLLRALEIPARMATGFLAHEWSDSEGAYLVRERDAHAWIEVYFEGYGWITLDPTPADARQRAFDASAGAANEGTQGWLGELRELLERWSGSAGRDVTLGELLLALVRVPFAAINGWGSAGLVGSLVLALALLARRSRPTGARDIGASTPAPTRDPLFVRLMQALERRGYRRPLVQTLREFARSVEHAGDAELRGLPQFVEIYYRAQFGARAWTGTERERVERFIERVERTNQTASD